MRIHEMRDSIGYCVIYVMRKRREEEVRKLWEIVLAARRGEHRPHVE